MSNIQSYLDAFSFLVGHTEILSRFSITLVVSIILGAIVLDSFKIWHWVAMMGAFLLLTQYQVKAVQDELGLTAFQIIQPHVITVLSSIFFAAGSGIGYFLKHRYKSSYTKKSAYVVASEAIAKANGGIIDNSNSTNQSFN